MPRVRPSLGGVNPKYESVCVWFPQVLQHVFVSENMVFVHLWLKSSVQVIMAEQEKMRVETNSTFNKKRKL